METTPRANGTATATGAPDVAAILSGVRDTLTVSRVFGAPIERDGTTLVPVATIGGGGGGGGGLAAAGDGGGGVGYGLSARPAGAFEISDTGVTWHPAIDTQRVVVWRSLTIVAVALVVRSIVRTVAGSRDG